MGRVSGWKTSDSFARERNSAGVVNYGRGRTFLGGKAVLGARADRGRDSRGRSANS